jgi:hypothetical protein
MYCQKHISISAAVAVPAECWDIAAKRSSHRGDQADLQAQDCTKLVSNGLETRCRRIGSSQCAAFAPGTHQ